MNIMLTKSDFFSILFLLSFFFISLESYRKRENNMQFKKLFNKTFETQSCIQAHKLGSHGRYNQTWKMHIDYQNPSTEIKIKKMKELTCLHQFHFGHLQQYHIRNSSPLIPAHNTGNVRITRKRKN